MDKRCNMISSDKDIFFFLSFDMFSSRESREKRIVDFAFGLVLLWDPKGSVVATDAFIPRRRVCHPDGHIQAIAMYVFA